MSGARDWLKKHQTATVQDLSNDMWVRIERTNRMLEQYGRGDSYAWRRDDCMHHQPDRGRLLSGQG